jgi:hypothetical protein
MPVHGLPSEDSRTDTAHNRAGKQRRVREGHAHAALVFDHSGTAQGWCQYGSPEELPGIKHKRELGRHKRIEKEAEALAEFGRCSLIAALRK